jgi:outer membrane protein OmpA-like peptidoglycan-associated protein
VLDRDDDCPLVHGGDNFSGCPDSDGDGVPDHIDRCPDEAGPPENDGCPILGKEELELIAKAQSRVQFRTGSDVLLSASLKVLDELVELMRRYPHYSLTIKGYTDNRGKDEVNLRLSKRRAKACHDYLLSKGISPNRMSHEGYGAQFPIGDNNTEEGRRLNRRVEFHMEMPDLLELMLR